jgi:hypothetical protein
MIAYLLPFVYLAVCGLTAYFGRNTRIGYWGTFFLTLFVTPFVTLIGLVLLGPNRRTTSRHQAISTGRPSSSAGV